MAQALIGCIGGALTAEDPKYCARDVVGRVCEHLGCSEPGNHVIRTVFEDDPFAAEKGQCASKGAGLGHIFSRVF